MAEYGITVNVNHEKKTATVLYREGGRLVGRITVESPDKGEQSFKVTGAGGANDVRRCRSFDMAIRHAMLAVADDIAELTPG